MKAFRFRLEQALRWRETQRSEQQTRVAAAAARKAGLEQALDAARRAAERDAVESRNGATGESLAGYASHLDRSRRQIGELQIRLREAAGILDREIGLWVEMNRKVRLLGVLKESGQAAWKADFERELESFAAESFLARVKK